MRMKIKHVTLVLCGILLSLNSLAIKPDRKYIRLPQHVGLIYKKLNVTTPDGYRIETWFYPAQEAAAPNAGQDDMLPYRVGSSTTGEDPRWLSATAMPETCPTSKSCSPRYIPPTDSMW